MKKLTLILWYMVFTSTAFGQQFLWTTLKDSTAEYVPIEKVTEKVLAYYDHYKTYFDGTGFSKAGFFKFLESSASLNNADTLLWNGLKRKINIIDSMTVMAFKSNLGSGSFILVMCISKENVDFIRFSNNFERGAILSSSYDKEKFEKWFKTLLE